MNESLLSAHRVLEYLMTKAAVSGKTLNSTVRVPFSELASSVGKTDFENVDLVIKFDLSWEKSKTDEEIELDDDLVEEFDNYED